jgi:hypothetical protein
MRQSLSAPYGQDPRGEDTLAGEGVGGPICDEGTDTLVLYVYYNPCTG